MPVDIQDGVRARPSKLGVIRLGSKEPNKKDDGDHPQESEFYLLHDAPQVEQAYGKQARELLVYLPFPTIAENLDSWHKNWSGTGMVHCKGDGKRIVTLWDDANIHKLIDGYVAKSPSIPTACPGSKYEPGVNGYPRCADCASDSTLAVIIRDPDEPSQPVGGRWGYYAIYTRSNRNAVTLLANLLDAQEMIGVGASLRGVPMILKRFLQSGSHVDKKTGKRAKDTHYYLSLEFDRNFAIAASRAMYERMLNAPPSAPALPEPVVPLPVTLDEQGRSIDFMTGEVLDPEPEAPQMAAPQPVEAQEGEFEDEPPEVTLTFPFKPETRLCDFQTKWWTTVWPFVAKRYNKMPSQVNAWIHNTTGFKSLKDCDWQWQELIRYLDEHQQAESAA